MTLTRTKYACSKCGRLQEVTTRTGELPPRRCTRRKISVSESSFVNGGASPARKLARVPGAAPKRKAPAASVALEFGSSILRATRDGAGRWTVSEFCGAVDDDDLERLVDILWGASA